MVRRLVLLLLIASVADAQTLTIPHTFFGKSSAPIQEFDQNWQAIADYVNGHTATVINVKGPPYNAKCDGSSDDTAPIQAALSVGGIVVFPAGACQITSTLMLTKGVILVGLGAGPGGILAPGVSRQAAILDHAFSGDFFKIVGVDGDVESSVGFGLENLVLRQAFGTGTGAAGRAVYAFATSDTFKPSWVRVRNVTFEVGTGKDDWTSSVYADGSQTTGPGNSQGMRNVWLDNVRTTSGTHSTAAIHFDGVGNAFITNSLINSSGGTFGKINLVGTGGSGDANHATSSIFISGTAINDTLNLDNANGVYCASCVAGDTVTMTANSVRLNFVGGRLGNAPTMLGLGNVVQTTINTSPVWLQSTGTVFTTTSFLFTNLATVLTVNGQFGYCSDCKVTAGTPGAPSTYTNNTCATGGNGALAIRLNGANVCYQ